MSLLKYLGDAFGINGDCPIVVTDCCVICLNPIHDGGRIDCCKHTFCFRCIKEWSERTNRCPECRKEFKHITRCKVYKDEEELQKYFSVNEEEIIGCAASSRISISGRPIATDSTQTPTAQSDGLYQLRFSDRIPLGYNSNLPNSSGLARRYSSR